MHFPTPAHLKYFLQLHEEEQQKVPPPCEFDWITYRNNFDAEHGGDPMVHHERLLYKDGWMYSLHDASGPEWAPPDDVEELQKLKKVYWTTRKGLATSELLYLRKQQTLLTDLQESKSMKLQLFSKEIDPETEQRKTVDAPFNELQARIDLLTHDAQECDQHLEELANST